MAIMVGNGESNVDEVEIVVANLSDLGEREDAEPE
jgi:hypothetical protein